MPIDERSVADAPESFALALRLCIDCQQYHALRPYLRGAGINAGVKGDWDGMENELARLIAEGRRRVLVLGSGDTGISSLVLSAARGGRLDLTVIDRCATPLVLIHRMASRYGIRVTTLQADLRSFDLPDAFDLVVGHHVLPFVPADGRLDLLRNAERALAPGGRLFLLVRSKAWRQMRDREFGDPAAFVDGFIAQVERSIADSGMAQPPDRATFDRHLLDFARERPRRIKNFDELQALLELFGQAGFAIEQRQESNRVRMSGGRASTLPESSGLLITARPLRHA